MDCTTISWPLLMVAVLVNLVVPLHMFGVEVAQMVRRRGRGGSAERCPEAPQGVVY